MRIAVLGTGVVGTTLAAKLAELGHEVTMGSRDAANENARAWAAAAGERGGSGTFADAAGVAELVVNATAGATSLEALEQAGEDALRQKVLVDVANPLDFSHGMPPTLAVANTDSFGEQIQRRFPETRVVKALNTVNHDVMVDPARIPREHDVFLCGEDAGATATVVDLLESFAWSRERIVDLGGIGASRAQEMYLPLWLTLFRTFGTPHVNVRVVR